MSREGVDTSLQATDLMPKERDDLTSLSDLLLDSTQCLLGALSGGT